MNVKCLSKSIGITPGKTYEVLLFSDNFKYILIKDDYGFDDWYPKDIFIDVQEERDKKIKQLGL
jgi:hypothetical protein